MKKKAKEIIVVLIDFLEKLNFRLSNKSEDTLGYSSLSPVNNVNDREDCINALLWSIQNRKEKDIKNIALTGPYGSGKSSILKTFQKKYKNNKEFKFLNISLATFSDELENSEDADKDIPPNTEILRLIETSILQQIFYHEEEKNIPDSRFKKIRSYSQIELFLQALGYGIILLSGFILFNPASISYLTRGFTLDDTTLNRIHFLSILLFFSGLFYFLRKSVRIINSLSINKLQFQNAEIGIDENLNKSVLNFHLDELLYFFKTVKYNIVIIEDLDRFKETQIFTKLREINLVLNESKKTKNIGIVFIYAVRDEIFSDKERTKFFDFIIPVIPTINFANSSAILITHNKNNQFGLSDSFIEDISFVVDDMRLLNNICNEFSIYNRQLNPNNFIRLEHNQNKFSEKLFAIITYKNLFPNDFALLSASKGEMFNILNSKQKFISEKSNIVDLDIARLHTEIKKSEDLYFKDLKNYRLLYILKSIEKEPKFYKFAINNVEVSFDQLAEDENFEYLINNNLDYYFHTYNNYSSAKFTHKFSEIEAEVNSELSYSQIKKSLDDRISGRTLAYKNEIKDLEYSKLNIRSMKISEIIQSIGKFNYEFQSDQENFKILAELMITNAYIGEDYLDYISLFHEGGISREDQLFSINVRNRNKLEYNFALNKIDKLIAKLKLTDFSSEYVLNFALVDFLLRNQSQYSSQIEALFIKLKDESTASITFIKAYFTTSQILEKFIELLASFWPNIWNFLSSDPSVMELDKKGYFKYILNYATAEDILKISSNSDLKNEILQDKYILNVISKEDKIREIVINLDLKFVELDFQNISESLLNFIYQNNFYELNPFMLKFFIKKYGNFDQQDFDNSNYMAIQQSDCLVLIEYVEKHINFYIDFVYLKITTNIYENLEFLITLLNHETLNVKIKKQIIDKVETKIHVLGKIKDDNVSVALFQKNKSISSWSNILYFHSRNEDRWDDIISYINIAENAKSLSLHKIPKEIEGKDIYSVLFKQVISENKIENESFKLVLNCSPWWFDDIPIDQLSIEKVLLLIRFNVLKPSEEVYVNVKEKFPHLLIDLLEKNEKEYWKIIDKFDLDSQDLSVILDGAQISLQNKEFLTNTIQEDKILNDLNVLRKLLIILTEQSSFKISDTIKKSILLEKTLDYVSRIKLFNQNKLLNDGIGINLFLDSLPDEFPYIKEINKRAKIPNTNENRIFLDEMKNLDIISSYRDESNYYRVYHKWE